MEKYKCFNILNFKTKKNYRAMHTWNFTVDILFLVLALVHHHDHISNIRALFTFEEKRHLLGMYLQCSFG
jgi:hypothetical protein